MDVGGLTPLEGTALLTVYARALDSRWDRSILGDTLAHEVVGKIDYDFAGLGVVPSVTCLVALRAKMLDERIRSFIAMHPDAVVVDLGAGLSSAVHRVAPPPAADWYSVDLPAVIKLRDALLPGREGSHSVAASVTKPDWVEAIPAGRPTMLVADGLFAFLSEPQIIAVLRRSTEYFASGIIAFNDYGKVGAANRLGKLFTRRKRMFKTMYNEWGSQGFKDAHHPETWNPDLTLVEEASAFRQPEVELFPPSLRLVARLGARIPAVSRKARILLFRF